MRPTVWPALLLTLAGCPKAPGTHGQDLVEDIRFKGRSGGLFSRDTPATLADQMEQGSTHRFVDLPGNVDFGPILGDPALLDEGRLDADSVRIVTWYQHHGWFDARVVRWDVELRRRRTAAGGRRVNLIGVVSPGARSVLDADVEVIGTGGERKTSRKSLSKLALLKRGDAFDVDAWHKSLSAIKVHLAEEGFAWATVEGSVVARPEELLVHASVEVDQGRRCVFGAITIVGEGRVPESRIRRELGIEEGDSFRPSKIDAARQALYALGVYGLVELVPDRSQVGSREIPISVRLKRRESRTLQLGPSVKVETDRQQLTLNAEYSDVDVFHRLLRWELTAEAGAAATVDPTQALPPAEQLQTTLAPVATLKTTFTIPGLVGGKVELGNAATGLLGVEPGYRELELEGSPSTTWKPDPRLAATLAYRVKYHQYFDYEAFSTIEASQLGVTLQPKYVLSIVEQKLVVDARDDKLMPTQGGYSAVVLGEAGGPLGGDFGFFRPTAELRGYVPFRRGARATTTVIAGRIAGGIILTYEPGADIDVDERLFLGGGNSVRGWGERRLGPSLEEDEVLTPVGGNLSANGSLELRQRLPASFGVVGFIDGGRVWDDPVNGAWATLAWSLGGGVRYYSPIGPIRVDFGWVLDTGGVDLGEAAVAHPWSIHLGLGEAF